MVFILGLLAPPSLRAAYSLVRARTARENHDIMAETAALDRLLLEAPPFLFGLRRFAIHRLAEIADDHGPAAWYAVLALTSATGGRERTHWQHRAMDLAAGRDANSHHSLPPFVPRTTSAPSRLLSALSTFALLGWILTAAAILTASAPPRRPAVAAAVLFWIVWIIALAAA